MSEWAEWPVEGWTGTVRIRRDLLARITGEMTAGFRRNSWGGVEVGGVLFGTQEGDRFSISEHRGVDCEHEFGPNYDLTDKDQESLQRAVEAAKLEGLLAAGWYKSVSNRELAITDGDSAVWAKLFPEGVLLILKRDKDGVGSGVIYCRGGGQVFSGRCKLEAETPGVEEIIDSSLETPKVVEECGALDKAPHEDHPAESAVAIAQEREAGEIEVPMEGLLALADAEDHCADSGEASFPHGVSAAGDLISAADATAPVAAFALTPDPSFFYPSAQHREALASLEYGITARKGFVMLVGEPGMGKTMVLECLSDRLNAAGIEYGFLFNSRVSRFEFFELLALDFGLKTASNSKTAVLMALNAHLMTRSLEGLTTALLIDDAQKLNAEVLEEIELLSNLETRKGKLLQVVMAARPEFEVRMNQPELAGLRQRFVLRPRLGALSREETGEYIHARLERVGQLGVSEVLPIDEIHRLSGGVPRLISAICGQLLERRGRNQDVPQALTEVAEELGLVA